MCLAHDDQLDKVVLPVVHAETEPKHADKWARKRCSFTRRFMMGNPCLLFRPVEAGSDINPFTGARN